MIHYALIFAGCVVTWTLLKAGIAADRNSCAQKLPGCDDEADSAKQGTDVAFIPSSTISNHIASLSAAVVRAATKSRRDRAQAAAVPIALEQISAELRSGRSVADGIEAVGLANGPLAGDMVEIRRRMDLGLDSAQALEMWSSSSEIPGVRAAAGALAVASGAGGSASGALGGLARSLRDRLDVAAEAHALSTQARWSAAVIVLTPPGFLVLSALGDQNSFRSMVGTPVGRACLVFGLALEVAGALWMRRIVRDEP